MRLAATHSHSKNSNRASVLWIGSLLVLLTLSVRLVPAWYLHNESADLAIYRDMASTALRGDNIYARSLFFPYTPFSQFIPSAMLELAEATGWRFDFTMKLPATLGDALVTALIFSSLLSSQLSLRTASRWSAFWALNPVSILITAFHGNLMPLVPCLVVAAFVCAQAAERSSQRGLWLALAALLLGMSIAMRQFPILYLPIFLVCFARTIREAVIFTSLASVASIVASVPYLIYAQQTFLRELLSYSGFPDFGWASVLRALSYLAGGPQLQNFDDLLLHQTKRLFLLGYAILMLLLPFLRQRSAGHALLVAPLLFYAVYAGVGAQYLIWVLPLAILLRDRHCIPFTLAALIALAGFYWSYHPDILFGQSGALFPAGRMIMALYAAGNLAVVILSAAWLVNLIRRESEHCLQSESPDRLRWSHILRRGWPIRAYASLILLLCMSCAVLMMQAGVRAWTVFQRTWPS